MRVCEFVCFIVLNVQIHVNKIVIHIRMCGFVYFIIQNIQIHINEIVTSPKLTYLYVRIRIFYPTKCTNSCKRNHHFLNTDVLMYAN